MELMGEVVPLVRNPRKLKPMLPKQIAGSQATGKILKVLVEEKTWSK